MVMDNNNEDAHIMYHGQVVAAQQAVLMDDALLMMVNLVYNRHNSGLTLYVDEVDPLTRLTADPHKVWHHFAETLYDVLHQADPNYKHPIPLVIPHEIAVSYDAHIRDVFIRECGETVTFGRYTKDQSQAEAEHLICLPAPQKTYIYR